MIQTTQEDKEILKELLVKKGYPEPNIKMNVYKNRRGRYKDIIVWMCANRATCRFEPIFVTNQQYELIDVKDLRINIKPTDF